MSNGTIGSQKLNVPFLIPLVSVGVFIIFVACGSFLAYRLIRRLRQKRRVQQLQLVSVNGQNVVIQLDTERPLFINQDLNGRFPGAELNRLNSREMEMMVRGLTNE
jgi:hypothetical protein